MSFTITTASGMRIDQYFYSIEELINSMKKNPNDRYWRNK